MRLSAGTPSQVKVMKSSDDNLLFYILGGCITRDIFRISRVSTNNIYRHVARSSLISLMSPPLNADKSIISKIEDNPFCQDFEKEVALGALRKNALKFRKLSEDSEYVFIIDLTEERNDILKIGNCYITNSKELQKTKICNYLNIENTIQAFSDEWKVLWINALDNFISALPLALRKRCIIHKVYMAECFIDEKDFLMEFGDQEGRIFIGWFNGFLKWLHNQLVLRLPEADILEVASEKRVAHIKHKWGFHPGHFCDEYYLAAWSEIKKILKRHRL